MLVREADHPHVRMMFDTYHLWIGVSKFEDLESLRDGELLHLHFEDTPATPVRELLEQRHRVLPGQGIAPLKRILEVIKGKKYVGRNSHLGRFRFWDHDNRYGDQPWFYYKSAGFGKNANYRWIFKKYSAWSTL